jgi:DNA helicase II / ATP-dependent DNA helicase PcrA
LPFSSGHSKLQLMVDLVEGLNPQQKEAVLHEGSPLLILAGAGSGKTKVLTHRIANFVHNRGIAPHKILAVTFTNKAAKEMKERIQRITGEKGKKKIDFPFLGTFHSISVRMLKVDGRAVGLEPTFTIYDTADQKDLVKEAMKSLNIDPKNINPNAIHATISSAKNDMVTAEDYGNLVGDFFTEHVAKIYPIYQRLLEERNAVDFDDLIMKSTLLLQKDEAIRNKYIDLFDEVLVDEYQDTNKAQYSLIKILAKDKQRISVVGDEDQSIYGWRGADIQNIMSFEKDFSNPNIIKLEQNYRSTQLILDAAYAVINKNTERRDKKLWSEKTTGPNIRIVEAQTEVDEALFITKTIQSMNTTDYKDMAVLYRANAQSRAIEEQFLKAKIPYRLIGGQRFYDRKEIKDVLGYLRIFYNPADSLSLLRVINTPARGIGPKTITELIEASQELKMPVVDLMTNIALIDQYKYDLSNLTVQQNKQTEGDNNHLFEEAVQETQSDPFIESLASFKLKLGDSKLLNNRNIIRLGQKVNDVRDYALDLSLPEFIKYMIENLDYMKYLSDGTKEGENRIDNIKELLSVASKYEQLPLDQGLSQFLEDVSLIEYAQDKDENDPNKQAVSLMTIHAAKGLEFETVFVGGMEEGIFPHSRSLADAKEMEEERRLAYVAITRAKVNLYLIYAISRNYFGNVQSNPVSKFIADIPEHLIEFNNTGQAASDFYDNSRFSDDFEYAEPEYMDLGDRVMHETFGEGKIVNIENNIVTVDFFDKGLTQLMAQYAKLRKV